MEKSGAMPTKKIRDFILPFVCDLKEMFELANEETKKEINTAHIKFKKKF